MTEPIALANDDTLTDDIINDNLTLESGQTNSHQLLASLGSSTITRTCTSDRSLLYLDLIQWSSLLPTNKWRATSGAASTAPALAE